MRLLLVDDDDANRLTLSALLADEGWSVDEAGTCAAAAARLAGAAYSVVLLDLGLPDGDGRCLVPRARAHPGTLVLLLTGADVDAATCAQADGVVRKGDSFEALVGLLPRHPAPR